MDLSSTFVVFLCGCVSVVVTVFVLFHCAYYWTLWRYRWARSIILGILEAADKPMTIQQMMAADADRFHWVIPFKFWIGKMIDDGLIENVGIIGHPPYKKDSSFFFTFSLTEAGKRVNAGYFTK
ncbi:MAG: hypothetical protein WC702_01225 [Patescibacteria group bacterium]|jgi:hypothetical protein